MTYENILVEQHDAVVTITLNRPKALNALNAATIKEISTAIDGLDASVRVVVFTGAGEKAFVAGADISEINSTANIQQGMAMSENTHALYLKLSEIPQIVIAAINGFALGGGFELALACDMRIASDKAQIGLPEINLGLIPGWGGAVRLQRLVGTGMAKYLVLTGERINAEEAFRLGLVEKVVPADQLITTVNELATKLSKQAPLAVNAAKRLITRAADMNLRDAIAYEVALFGQLTISEDMKEGTSAFLEKRAANWQGK